MTLSEIIYEKSQHLSEDKANEVIDFIDFIMFRSERASKSNNEQPLDLTPEQLKAYDFLNTIHVDWEGKPFTDREEANARR